MAGRRGITRRRLELILQDKYKPRLPHHDQATHVVPMKAVPSLLRAKSYNEVRFLKTLRGIEEP